jgi:hypothetical protein
MVWLKYELRRSFGEFVQSDVYVKLATPSSSFVGLTIVLWSCEYTV